jgi:hypothetical protein
MSVSLALSHLEAAQAVGVGFTRPAAIEFNPNVSHGVLLPQPPRPLQYLTYIHNKLWERDIYNRLYIRGSLRRAPSST